MMKRKVLIIDDETNFTQMVKFNLEETGEYEVFVENEALEGFNAALKYHPDLILLDVIMPGMEGPDVIFQLKSTEDVKEIPVVFLTATITKEEVTAQHGIIAGHTFLAKPTSVVELVDCIEAKMHNRY